MKLAIFDLDNTLLHGDSDFLWGEFICQKGLVDKHQYHEQNRHFHQQYMDGELDIEEFVEFVLTPLSGMKKADFDALHAKFMEQKIKYIMTRQARKLIAKHRDAGHTLLIITATNELITTPIAKAYEIDNLLATRAEVKRNVITGKSPGTPCFQDGKITRLDEWLEENNYEPEETWFYSDSRNDIPLLEKVDNPVAVDPDDALFDHAQLLGWDIMWLHKPRPSEDDDDEYL